MHFPVYEISRVWKIFHTLESEKNLITSTGKWYTFPCMHFPVYEISSVWKIFPCMTISRVWIFPCMTNIQVTSLHGNQTIILVITREFSCVEKPLVPGWGPLARPGRRLSETRCLLMAQTTQRRRLHTDSSWPRQWISMRHFASVDTVCTQLLEQLSIFWTEANMV